MANRLLCATDLLPKTEPALDRAGLLADQLEAPLALLHVVSPIESELALEQELQRTIACLKSRARAPLWRQRTVPSVVVRAGKPASLIAETASELGAKLLVLGAHRKRGAADALGGTIAEKLLTARKCPLLIVQSEPQGPYRSVLLALDLSGASAAAVRAAEALVLGEGTRAAIVHAYEPPYEGVLAYVGMGTAAIEAYGLGWKREAGTAIRDLLKWHSSDFTRYRVILEEASPATAILRAAERMRPDLLVMGTRGHGRVRRALLGSVASRVLHEANCDVLVVPDGSFEQPTRGDAPPMRSGRGRPALRNGLAA